MLKKSTIAAGILACSMLGLAAVPASAAGVAPGLKPLAQSTITESLVQEVRHHRHGRYSRCRGWRRECSFRWGFGTRRYNRCMFLHGCW